MSEVFFDEITDQMKGEKQEGEWFDGIKTTKDADRERQSALLETHQEKAAGVLVAAFATGRGNPERAYTALKVRTEELGFDLTEMDPFLIAGNKHIVNKVTEMYRRIPKHTPRHPAVMPSEIAWSLQEIFTKGKEAYSAAQGEHTTSLS
jgi:hypothetical protein